MARLGRGRPNRRRIFSVVLTGAQSGTLTAAASGTATITGVDTISGSLTGAGVATASIVSGSSGSLTGTGTGTATITALVTHPFALTANGTGTATITALVTHPFALTAAASGTASITSVSIGKYPADNVGITDSVTVAITYNPTVADNIAITDAGGKTSFIAVSDSVGITDAEAIYGTFTRATIVTAAPDVETPTALEDVVRLSGTAATSVSFSTDNLVVGPARATISIGLSGSLDHVAAMASEADISVSSSPRLHVVPQMTDIKTAQVVSIFQTLTLVNGPIYSYTRTNLVPNPEPSPTRTADWGTYNSAGTISQANFATGGPTNGPYDRITATVAGGTGSIAGAYARNIPVTAGTTYTASFYARSSVAAVFQPTIEWHVSNGGAFSGIKSSDKSASVTLTPNVWTRVSVTGSCPSDATSAVVNGYSTFIQTLNATQDMTMVLLESGSTLDTFFDGDSAGTATDAYAWTGTVGDSSSTDLRQSAVGGVETGVPGPTGKATWRLTRNEASPVGWGAFIAANAFDDISHGASITISVWWRMNAGGTTTFAVTDDPNTSSPTSTTWPLLGDGTWHHFQQTVTLTSDWVAGVHRFRAATPNLGSGDYIEWSDATVTVSMPLALHAQPTPKLAMPEPDPEPKKAARVHAVLR